MEREREGGVDGKEWKAYRGKEVKEGGKEFGRDSFVFLQIGEEDGGGWGGWLQS